MTTPVEEHKPKHRFSLFSIFFTFFVDNLGATIIFPIFAPLFLNPKTGLFSEDIAYNLKAALLGIFLGAYPLGQFIFAPLIGEFADRFGRKLAFLVTAGGTLIGFVLCALSIMERWIGLLFISRLLMGTCAGNLSICLSALADLSNCEKTKVKYFSLGSIVAGVTFVLGPFIGGKLSDPSVHPSFNPAFPIWIGAILTAINLIFLAFAFVETLKQKKVEKLDLIKGLHNVQLALKTPSIKKLYLMYFFYLLSWNMLFQFIPAFLVSSFSASNSTIGDISAIMGVCWIVGSVVLTKALLHKIKNKTLLVFSAIAFAVLVVSSVIPRDLTYFIFLMGASVIVASFGWPLCAGAISNSASKAIQGKIFGLSQSIQSLAMMIAPIVVGPFLSKHSGFPFFISAGVSLLFGGIVIGTKIRENSDKNVR